MRDVPFHGEQSAVSDANVTTHRDALAASACAQGGWGYAPEQAAHLEPTALALLALSADRDRHATAIAAGLAFLRQCAHGDGTYRLTHGRPEAAWPTALVLFVHASLNQRAAEVQKTAAALLGLRGRELDAKDDEDVNDIDPRIIGWPWAQGNFSWVEPTAWAVLALKRAVQGSHPRVHDGEKLLLDRVLEEGGVNYGNRRIFGVSLEPIPTPTALALLGLQGVGDDPRIGKSIAYLCRQSADATLDLEHLCWSRLALDAWREHDGVADALARLGERIRAAHEDRIANPWVRPAPLRQALTTLALNIENTNPFRRVCWGMVSDHAPADALAPGKVRTPRPGFGERITNWFRAFAINAHTNLRDLGPQTQVHIAPAGNYNDDLADVVRRQYDHFRERVPLKGKRVVLKPNLVEYHRDKVINTHPHVVAAVIELCRREDAAEVIVAEGPGHWRNVEYLVAASGLGDVLRHYKVPFIDLNHDEPVKRPNRGRLTKLDYLYLSRTIATADVVISLPKLKTHHWAVATLSLKNLFGTLPGICYGWPKNELHWRGIDNSIVDIACTRTPDLAIVDGIIGMEGDGPLNGTAKPMSVLLMGSDLIAVDATCCRLMQLDPEKVGYLVMGHHKKLGLLGAAQIEQLGETIEGRAKPFETVAHFKSLWVGRTA
jgi:uncharacterized protein (DUF362 family)